MKSYQLEDGWEICAGQSDRENDELSLRTAHPADYWFHVKALPGSHVLLRHPKHAEADKTLLETAAAVAAWHSKARQAGIVPVDCTRARDVSKPKKAKPGTVTIRRQKVIKVRPALPAD